MNICNNFLVMNQFWGLSTKHNFRKLLYHKYRHMKCSTVQRTLEHPVVVFKVIGPRATATVDELKIVVSKINHLEEEISIPPWNDANIPEEIVAVKPNPG